MTTIVLLGLLILFIGISVFLSIMVFGAIRPSENLLSYKRKKLTGVQIEEIKRKLLSTNQMLITKTEILDLIYTIKALQLGDYIDKDPYMPDDPYDGIEESEDIIVVPAHRA